MRIGCKDFVKYLSSLTGLKFSPAIRYVAKYDIEEQIVYISVLNTPEIQEDGEVDDNK